MPSTVPDKILPPLALLAGGLGTRLQASHPGVPKAMVEVAGEPFIHHQLNLLRREGLTRVVLCIGHLGGAVRDYVQDGSAFGIKVDYSEDGEKPLGTGGAIRKALPLLGDAFWVMYGDAYLDVRFAPIWRHFSSQNTLGLMTVFCNNNSWDRSNVLFEKGRIASYDKKNPSPSMRHIDFGLSIFRKPAFDAWKEGRAFDLAEVHQDLIGRGELLGYEVDRRFYEIGSPEGLAQTRIRLEQPEGPFSPLS